MKMFPKPHALPRPSAAYVSGLSDKTKDGIEYEIHKLLSQRKGLIFELGVLEKRIEYLAASICGKYNNLQHVEVYDGTLGVTQAFVAAHEQAVGQLQWVNDLHVQFRGAKNSPGTVEGERWGSGALLEGNLFLTAGHCFDPFPPGYVVPERNGVTILPDEIATLMRVNFNYQQIGNTTKVHPDVPFPVSRLLEYKRGNLDYAIVELGPDNTGRMPNDLFRWLNLAKQDLTTPQAMLCIIGHPNGEPKQIEAGPILSNSLGTISYDDIDTGGGASGAPILHPVEESQGEIVGVHTTGGCTPYGGSNSGVAIGAIRKVSKIV